MTEMGITRSDPDTEEDETCCCVTYQDGDTEDLSYAEVREALLRVSL